jgi:hypothetical protein
VVFEIRLIEVKKCSKREILFPFKEIESVVLQNLALKFVESRALFELLKLESNSTELAEQGSFNPKKYIL